MFNSQFDRARYWSGNDISTEALANFTQLKIIIPFLVTNTNQDETNNRLVEDEMRTVAGC